jgi:hypothetical protein
MAHLARSVAALRIIGDDLVPEEVSSLLGAPPTRAERKGEAIPTKTGERIAKTGGWRLEAMATEPENLDAQVSELLSLLTSDLEVWHTLRERYRLDLFCGWFMNESNEGVSISPSTLLALGQRGIELGLDIYAPSPDA